MIPLHVHTTTESGGAAQVARTLHRCQRAAGTEARMVAGWGNGDPDSEIYSFQNSRGVTDAVNVAAYRATGSEGPLNLHRWKSFLKSQAFTGADVIHLHNAHGYYLPQQILEQLTDKPCVWTLHDFWMMTGRCASPGACRRFEEGCPSCPIQHRYPASLVDKAASGFKDRRRLWSKPQVIFATPTELTRQQFIEQGMPEAKIRKVNNPIDFPSALMASDIEDHKSSARARLGIDGDKKVVLFVSRKLSDPMKGIAETIEALSRLGQREDVCAIFIGEAQPRTNREIEALQLQALSPGLVGSRDRMTDYLLASDIVVSPSRSETFGLTNVEAVIAGSALIVGDLPAVREVLSSEPANHLRFVDAGSAMEIADNLSDLLVKLARPDFAQRQSLIERYDPARVTRDYLDLYEEVAS